MGLQSGVDGREESLSVLLGAGVWWGQGQVQRLSWPALEGEANGKSVVHGGCYCRAETCRQLVSFVVKRFWNRFC